MNQLSEKKKILITGAFGFIGSNLLKNLCNDYELLALDLQSASPPTPPAFAGAGSPPALPSVAGEGGEIYPAFFSWQDLDLIPWDSIDTVIHLAGKAHDTRNTAAEQEYFDINVGLTEKIAERFFNSSAKKLIYFSSVKAVADSWPEGWLTEEVEPDPKTAYGRSKLEAESVLTRVLSSRLEPGSADTPHPPAPSPAVASLPGEGGNPIPNTRYPIPDTRNLVYILRPCMIHGPGNKGNLNELVRFVKSGLPWPLGAFENQRSFTSIDNLVYIIKQLIDRDIEPGIYQMADDEPLSTNELIRMIATAMKKKSRIWKISPGIIRGATRIGDRLGLSLNRERLQKLTESYRVSNRKLKNALGVDRMPVAAAEGLKTTLQSL